MWSFNFQQLVVHMSSEWKHTRFLKCRLRNGTPLLLLHSVGQSNSQKQSRFRQGKINIFLDVRSYKSRWQRVWIEGRVKYCIYVFLISCSISPPQGVSFIVGSSVSPPGLSVSLSREIISPSSNPSSDLKKTLISCNFIMQNVYFSLLTVFSFPVTFSPKNDPVC